MLKDDRLTAGFAELEGPLSALINGAASSETARRMVAITVGDELAREMLSNMERALDEAGLPRQAAKPVEQKP